MQSAVSLSGLRSYFRPIRLILVFQALLAAFLYLLMPAVLADEQRWDALRTSLFKNSHLNTDGGVLALEVPERAHDPSAVPVVIKALDSGRRIEQIHLIVDMNPLPLAGVFRFAEEAGSWHAMETQIRVNEYTHVRAVAQLKDGSLHMDSRFVKASGGCSAPALSDMDAAMAGAGNMQLMIDKINNKDALASEATIKISHPNNSGMQFDQISRNYIPAFYINTINVDYNGKRLMQIDTNFSLSENPVVRFQFDADSEVEQSSLTAYVSDSKGNRYQHSVTLENPG